MENNEVIKQLFEKYLSGQCTRKEIEYLMQNFSTEREDFLHQLIYNYYTSDTKEDFPAVPSSVYEKINLQINRRTVKLWPRFVAAASVAILVASGGYFYYQSGNSKPLVQSNYTNEVAPGKNGATLTLADGRKIRLSDAVNGELSNEAGVSITKTKDGQLIYEIKETGAENNKFNTLSTSNGETYQVRLPDGSAVWLNAASSLTYSAKLIQNGKRSVTLSGEAYFQVTKDKSHPFVVSTAGQQVEVLGTHFNVNAYADEPITATTLVEGSVKVSSGSDQQMLKPGFQARNNGNGIKISKVNLEGVTDWKDGEFNLDETDFRVAMRKIARWYDVEVIYEKSVPMDIEAWGWISRDSKLSSVLKLIENSGMVKFRIDGKKVYVFK